MLCIKLVTVYSPIDGKLFALESVDAKGRTTAFTYPRTDNSDARTLALRELTGNPNATAPEWR